MTEIDSNQADESILTFTPKDCEALRILYGNDYNNISTTLIRRALFLEYLPALQQVVYDSMRIYSKSTDSSDESHYEHLKAGHIIDCLTKLVETKPMQSYLRLSYRQLVNFTFNHDARGHVININFLVSFINEMRAAFSTICQEDRRILRLNASFPLSQTLILSLIEDASFLINWSIIEAAKYCVNRGLAPKSSPNSGKEAILGLIQKEITAPMVLGEKVSKVALVKFLESIDKLLFDRTSDSSTGKHTCPSAGSIDQFYKLNGSILKSWFAKNRINMGRLSLLIDDPAECWRNMSIKLHQDLTARYQCFNSTVDHRTFNGARMHLNTKGWFESLNFLALSAKQLNDLQILQGLGTLVGVRDVIFYYPPLEPMILNMEGRFEETYNLLKSSRMDNQTIIEFLDACIELDLMEGTEQTIKKLNCEHLQYLYRTYHDSKVGFDEPPEVRLEEVNKWLQTWTIDLSDSLPDEAVIQPYKTHIDIVIPACANIISKLPPEGRSEHIERLETLMCQDFLCHCLFPPSLLNKRLKVNYILIDILKGNTIPQDLVDAHAKDLYWNHHLYRTICDLNVIEKLQCDNNIMDIIQLRAAKYNQRKGNTSRASLIAKNLADNINAPLAVRMQCSFITEKNEPDSLLKLASDIESSGLPITCKIDLESKVLRRMLKLASAEEFHFAELSELVLGKSKDQVPDDQSILSVCKWQDLIGSSSLSSKIKTLSLFSKRSNQHLDESDGNDELVKATFKLNFDLLDSLCQSNTAKHRSTAIEHAVRLLNLISSHHSHLNKENLDTFSSDKFVSGTMNLWINLRANLISLITHHQELPDDWRNSLINIVKSMVRMQPNLLIYSVISNRLDLQSELITSSGEVNGVSPERHQLLTSGNRTTVQSSIASKREDLNRKLAFWNELFEFIKTTDKFKDHWHEVMDETERFIKEIRRISFLRGENLKALIRRIPKRLDNFMDFLDKISDGETGGTLECHKRLKSICDQALKSIAVLLSYNHVVNSTQYDSWFCETFVKPLNELQYRLNLLSKKRLPFVKEEIRKLINSITELFGFCSHVLATSSMMQMSGNDNKLYMELISPTLSRLQPSFIPMPEHSSEPMNPSRPIITIHKVSQIVDIIPSKTSPKKLKFTGSDGVRRSFLLKAHEDLRLDQLVVDLYSTISGLLLGHKETQDKHRIRTYSVTPVSSRSGLIQWIEAPSIFSFYRAWLDGPRGKAELEKLYASTCETLCGEAFRYLAKSAHHDCQLPSKGKATDIFYQLLWQKTKISRHPLTDTRPFSGNIIRYRNTFEPSIFQDIVEQLSNLVPKELIANQLWFKSNNSYSYWSKTQEFINSCATISMVGYIIGLGDRHLDNILLDLDTGEVIHIDQNVCFEFGKALSIPEQVPFRLTRNFIHAFGFAGLEGGFTLSCRRVLNVLKEYRSTILHLLDPLNMSFMIQSFEAVENSRETVNNLTNYVESKVDLAPKNPNNHTFGSDMCSQECLDIEEVKDVDDLLILQPDSKNMPPAASPDVLPARIQPAFSCDLQNIIKTPTKIRTKVAVEIHRRIKDKLSGTDEHVRHFKSKKVSAFNILKSTKQEEVRKDQASDLITLDDAQNTEDQVEALILEATSVKNTAAMYEGWTAWV